MASDAYTEIIPAQGDGWYLGRADDGAGIRRLLHHYAADWSLKTMQSEVSLKAEGDDITFSTGKTISVNQGVVGLGPPPMAYPTGGYDDGINPYDSHFDREGITPGECVELADMMIKRWQEFRKKQYGMREALTDAVFEEVQRMPSKVKIFPEEDNGK